MCFSAIVEQDLARLKREFKAKPDLGAFKRLFGRRASGEKIIIPRAMEYNFRFPAATVDEADIAAIVAEHRRKLDLDYREKLKEQQERLADAQTALARKVTKTMQNEERIAGNKIRYFEEKIADLPRRASEPQDARIFPLHYAPVIVIENGERVIKPMRYLLRRPGDPVEVDDLRNGCYNARRDNLDRYWKRQFGKTQAICVVTSFYENVAKHVMEHRELAPGEKKQNVVLQFDPKPAIRMWVACLYADWNAEGEQDLLSFAAVTDEPPEEISATGHDRCIVPVSEENAEAWLNPQGLSSEQLHRILEQRERPYYEHRIAA